MKKILYAIFAVVLSATVASCWTAEFPTETTPRYEVLDLEVVAGDEEILISWSPKEGTSPVEYIVSYTLSGETQSVKTAETSYTLAGVINGQKYTIAVQAVYSNGEISNKVSKDATPKTTRFPVLVLNVESGNAYAVLTWEKPHETLLSYKLTYGIQGETPKTLTLDKDQTELRLENLENVKLYNFSLVGVYQRGESSAITAVAMPCEFAPYQTDSKLVVGRPATFKFNSTDYPDATDIVWSFAGEILEGAEVQYTFWSTSVPEVKLTVNLGGNTVTWPVIISEISEYLFVVEVGGVGTYAATPLISPDGTTVYINTRKPLELQARDINTGELKWKFETGITVNMDYTTSVNPVTGDIHLGGTEGNFWCVKADGTEKWKYAGAASLGDGMTAVNAAGTVVYILDSKGSVIALNTADGSEIWANHTDSGIAGGLLVNGSELVVGTQAKIYFLNIADGSIIKEIDQQVWRMSGFAAAPDKKTVYFPYPKGMGVLDLEKKEITKTFEVGTDNNWGIAVSPDGSVFVGNKDGNAYCLEPGLTAIRWSHAHLNTSGDVVGSAFNFSHPVADNDNNFYITSTSNGKKNLGRTYKFNSVKGMVEEYYFAQDPAATQQGGNQLFNGCLFASYNGAPGYFTCRYVGGERAQSGWASVGGDVYGSNCLK